MQIDSFAQRQHRFLNWLHTVLLVGGSLLLFVACAFLFLGPGGIFQAAIFAAVSLFMASRVSPALVLRMYKAHPVGREEFPVGHAILDALAERAGLPARPKLYVMPSNLMNAFAVGKTADSAICFTDKLIRSLTQRELAGVMAHEVSHIVNGDIKVMAIADMVSRFTSLLSTFGIVSLLLNLPGMLSGQSGFAPWPAVVLLLAAPTIGGLLQLALSRTREFDADLGAVMLTGDPDGLAGALRKLEAAQGQHWEGMVLPGSRNPQPSLLRTHPLTADRIKRLMAMKEPGEQQDEPQTTAQRTVRKSQSPVPKIRPTFGRDPSSSGFGHASLMGFAQLAPLDHPHEDSAACEQSLNPPQGKPRIRILHGGVYW